MKLRSYPEYKDSGVPWLGEVPRHWNELRLGQIAFLIVSNVDKHSRDDEVPVRLCNYVDVYKNERITENIDFMKATASTSEIARFRIKMHDVLITKDSEVWDDIAVPALVEHESPDLLCGYHLAILRPKPIHIFGPYLFRLIQSKHISAQFHIEANGVTRYGLSHGAIKRVFLPIPPIEEQTQIARFLDWKTAQIDRFIRNKRRLIELLKEQKQALINQAVTGQIDVRTGKPYPEYKNSGVPWLGKVPAHWSVRKLKYIGDMQSGDNLTSEEIQVSGIYPVYGGNGQRGYYHEYNRDGHFLLIGRQGALCGNVHRVDGKFWATEHAVVVKPSPNVS